MIKIEKEYKATALFEISISYNGFAYLIIYGNHINGYYCCVPGYGFGCEMSDPKDVYYNSMKLIESGADADEAKAIATAIKDKSLSEVSNGQ